jgi:hypothetical protein
MDIKADELLEPDLVLQDFIRAVQTARPTVNEQDIEQHTKFTNDFGKLPLLFLGVGLALSFTNLPFV